MTDGGIVTYANGAPRIVLPDSAFEYQLAQTFQDNGCSSCVISIVACGGNADGAKDTRTTIATRTGCTVYGAKPPVNDDFITIGHCPVQKWYTLDPKGKAEEDPRADQSICAGPVPMERYDPADPVPINPIGPIPVY